MVLPIKIRTTMTAVEEEAEDLEEEEEEQTEELLAATTASSAGKKATSPVSVLTRVTIVVQEAAEVAEDLANATSATKRAIWLETVLIKMLETEELAEAEAEDLQALAIDATKRATLHESVRTRTTKVATRDSAETTEGPIIGATEMSLETMTTGEETTPMTRPGPEQEAMQTMHGTRTRTTTMLATTITGSSGEQLLLTPSLQQTPGAATTEAGDNAVSLNISLFSCTSLSL